MSLTATQLVWASSGQSGSHLLVMLALADHADADLVAWPSVPTLAQRCRIKERQVQYILRDLVERGEIQAIGKRLRGVSQYRIALCMEGVEGDLTGAAGCTPGAATGDATGAPGCTPAPSKGAPQCTLSEGPTGAAGCTPFAPRGALQCTAGVHPSAPKLSLNLGKKEKGVFSSNRISSFPARTVRNSGDGLDAPSPVQPVASDPLWRAWAEGIGDAWPEAVPAWPSPRDFAVVAELRAAGAVPEQCRAAAAQVADKFRKQGRSPPQSIALIRDAVLAACHPLPPPSNRGPIHGTASHNPQRDARDALARAVARYENQGLDQPADA